MTLDPEEKGIVNNNVHLITNTLNGGRLDSVGSKSTNKNYLKRLLHLSLAGSSI